jgi:hypothetical protein
MNEREALLDRAAGPLLLWSLGMLILLLLLLSLHLWLVIEYVHFAEAQGECDTPLFEWYSVLLVEAVLNVVVFNTKWFLPVVCRFEPEPHRPPPTRVKVYSFCRWAFTGTWLTYGLVWALSSETCAKTAPGFYSACLAVGVVGLLWWVLCSFSVMGLVRLAVMMGLASTGIPAPEGTLERAEVVPFDEETFDDTTAPVDCPICLSPFDADMVIRRTPCNHYIHEECLKGWLQQAQSCPLCRANLHLYGAQEEEKTGVEPESIGAPSTTIEVGEAADGSTAVALPREGWQTGHEEAVSETGAGPLSPQLTGERPPQLRTDVASSAVPRGHPHAVSQAEDGRVEATWSLSGETAPERLPV